MCYNINNEILQGGIAMQIKAYAKINLYLDVTGKRDDGYHNIIGIMQSVDLYDLVTVTLDKSAPGEICLRCGGDLPCDGRNLAYRAANAYFTEKLPCRIEIDVQKNIPMEAGLAGGSADCAAVLRALNAEFGRYSESQLMALGTSLGADVPFCLVGGTQITKGIGQELTPCPGMPDCYTLIARGGQGVSTPAAYRALDHLYGEFTCREQQGEKALITLSNAMREQDLAATCAAMYNVFEQVVLPEHKIAASLKKSMLSGGAVGCIMSGSGPSIVGFFDDISKAEAVCRDIRKQGIAAYVARPINR